MKSLEQPAQIGNLQLESSLIASSSSATARLEDLQALNRTAVGGIITKSGTVLEREGNPETNYYHDGTLAVNAKGLPGPDIDGTMKMLEEFNAERKKHLILSLAGMKPTEYLQLVRHVRQSIGKTFDAIELNLSCPNVQGKPIISYDPDATEAITAEILSEFPELCLGVKLAPFFNEQTQSELRKQIQAHVEQTHPDWYVDLDNPTCYGDEKLWNLINVLNKLHLKGLQFVSATNTFPNCRLTDGNGRPIINQKANLGRAGLSGDFLRPIAVENVRTLSTRLHPDITVIGTGGVKNAETANQFFAAGADLVAIGTALVEHGPKVVQDILLS